MAGPRATAGSPRDPSRRGQKPSPTVPARVPWGDARAPPATAFPVTAGPGGWQDGPPLGKSSAAAAAAAAGGPQTPRDSAPPRRGPGPRWAPAPSTLTLPPLWASEGPDPGASPPFSLLRAPAGPVCPPWIPGPNPRTCATRSPRSRRGRACEEIRLIHGPPEGARSAAAPAPIQNKRGSPNQVPELWPTLSLSQHTAHPQQPLLRTGWQDVLGMTAHGVVFGVGHVCTEAHGSHSSWDWEGKSHLADGH
ncbi:basic proline-rich protein-like [Camelus ferus]|uniref:Basic proline-rich protein-like n=1 Tax=Camelus ferus TaxID=419612 RepID=A0A8B8RIY6_CAMFR|nr:basic proline-rich protein-like [Camelus ferus]